MVSSYFLSEYHSHPDSTSQSLKRELLQPSEHRCRFNMFHFLWRLRNLRAMTSQTDRAGFKTEMQNHYTLICNKYVKVPCKRYMIQYKIKQIWSAFKPVLDALLCLLCSVSSVRCWFCESANQHVVVSSLISLMCLPKALRTKWCWGKYITQQWIILF